MNLQEMPVHCVSGIGNNELSGFASWEDVVNHGRRDESRLYKGGWFCIFVVYLRLTSRHSEIFVFLQT